jgi:hypothetical protein
MNRLLNRAQWEKSNDLTLIEIELILMKMLMIEAYSSVEKTKKTQVRWLIYILYVLSSWILEII